MNFLLLHWYLWYSLLDCFHRCSQFFLEDILNPVVRMYNLLWIYLIWLILNCCLLEALQVHCFLVLLLFWWVRLRFCLLFRLVLCMLVLHLLQRVLFHLVLFPLVFRNVCVRMVYLTHQILAFHSRYLIQCLWCWFYPYHLWRTGIMCTLLLVGIF